jgi:hypothetical protein
MPIDCAIRKLLMQHEAPIMLHAPAATLHSVVDTDTICASALGEHDTSKRFRFTLSPL